MTRKQSWKVDACAPGWARILVVNQPDGVDPDAFSAALRLGGWKAVRALHSQLRPAVSANFPSSK